MVVVVVVVFFLFNITHMRPSRSWRDYVQSFIPSAVRAVAARCKFPFALRPGLSQEDVVRTKEVTKERTMGREK